MSETKKSPKVVTVFGREVKLRGNLESEDFNERARGAHGPMDVRAMRHEGSYEFVVYIGGATSGWRRAKSLSRAIASAEKSFRKQLALSEASVKAARKIVGRA